MAETIYSQDALKSALKLQIVKLVSILEMEPAMMETLINSYINSWYNKTKQEKESDKNTKIYVVWRIPIA